MNLITDTYPTAEAIHEFPLHGMDLILCRNVFIYFKPEVVSKVVEKMTTTLRDGGYLMTGHAELRAQELTYLKTKVFPESVVYQKNAEFGVRIAELLPEVRTQKPEVRMSKPTLPLIPSRQGRGGIFAPSSEGEFKYAPSPLAGFMPGWVEGRGEGEKSPCIILSIGSERIGLLIDALVDEQEVVLKPHSAILKHVRNVSGATILATGDVCMVLNPHDLLKSVSREASLVKHEAEHEIRDTSYVSRKAVLLAEDSITTRTQEKRILEGAGYEVVTAVDGVDAFSKLNSRPFDAVVSDILMPNMDGLTLTEKIRQDKRFKELPVILVTTLASDEDRKRGLEAGANAYIAKPTFDQKVLLEILGRLV